MEDRIVEFEEVKNCRTLGGLVSADGRRVAPGVLYRSAFLANATPEDLRRLRQELGVTLVVDLRTTREREEKPDRVPEGARYSPRPVFDERREGVSHESEPSPPPPGEIPPMEDVYRLMAGDEHCRANLGATLREIMEHVLSGGTALWHCTEGKDRCGLVSAFLLSALGVTRAAVREDYLLTNRENAPKAERIRAEVLAEGKTPEEADRIRDLVLAKGSYFDAAFEIIDERFGGVDAYLREGLGLSEELVRAFRTSALV